MTICLTYPNEYPAYHVLIELKSKTIGQKLLDGLVRVSEVSFKDASCKYEQAPLTVSFSSRRRRKSLRGSRIASR